MRYDRALRFRNEPAPALPDSLLSVRRPGMMRCFAGMSWEDTAAALQVSTDTVKRDGRSAKLLLLKELRPL